MFSEDFLFWTILTLPPLLLSLTVHEFAHARTAQAFGDDTARLMGRCTLNPMAHLDFIGTLMLLFSGVVGWAKPVPVNPNNLHPRRIGDMMVSWAGPMSNLSMAVLCALILHFLPGFLPVPGADESPVHPAVPYVYVILVFTLMANVGLAIFNLVPLFPLDGHHILREALPNTEQRIAFMHWQHRYGVIVLAAVLFAPRLAAREANLSWLDPVGWVRWHVIGKMISVLGLEQPFLYAIGLMYGQ